MPRLLLPVLVNWNGPNVPPLEKLDPLLFDEPDDEGPELLVDVNAESDTSLCAHTPSISRVLVTGT